jgi:hypothetical protein
LLKKWLFLRLLKDAKLQAQAMSSEDCGLSRRKV